MSPADPAKSLHRKIKTREELQAIIGEPPRKKSVILCHGTFDIVHPGHLRHLMYCRDKADILVASLTSDNHINKSNFRPFVPQDLRAVNLAAFEIVDYVIIDPNPTPLENLKFLKPDFYAKGYEYFKDGVPHPKTQEEMNVIDSYGGEIIFTPGDIVYSSSYLIDNAPPKISEEKLKMLMDAEGLSFDDLRKAVTSLAGTRVHVVGDTIVDTYTYCSMIGGGTKTPTLSVRHDRAIDYSGGAAVVAKHMRAAGGEVHFSTVLGEDPLKDFVLQDLKACGVHCHEVGDRTRPTTRKNVFIAEKHRLLKVDTLDNRSISERIVTQLKTQISTIPTDVVVFADFRHGMFNAHTISELTKAIPKDVLKVADSQVASRWGNILDFKGFDLITPNEREARFALGDQDSVVRPLALSLYEKADCNVLILKMGERGILTYRRAAGDPRAFFTVDSFTSKVVDPVGAGDALLSYATLALAKTKSPVIASILGSMAAAVCCESDGNNPVSPEAVLKIIEYAEKKIMYQGPDRRGGR